MIFKIKDYLQPERIEGTRIALMASFERYLKFMFHVIEEKKITFEPFHKVICQKLDDIAKGKNEKRNLCVNVPVGAGKSLLLEYFITWCFARNINNAFIYTSYNNDLILKLSKEAREICQHPVWIQLFNEHLKDDDKSKGQWSFQGSRNRTGLIAKAMGGSITGLDAGIGSVEGFSGALIIDDPVDPVGALMYEKTRQECITFYGDKLTTRRRTPTTPTILVMQRVHKEDLTGWIKASEPEQWDSVVIPAIDGKGESFWPERYTVEEMTAIRETNPYMFQAQYQQDPMNAGGNVIKPEWFQYYDSLPEAADRIFITADTAQKIKEHNDYTVFMSWMVRDKKLYLVDMLRGKYEAPELLERAKAFYKRNHNLSNRFCSSVYIEDKASGTGLIQQLKREGHVPVRGIPRSVGQDKLTRVQNAVTFLYRGDVFLPVGPEYGNNPSLLAECASFQADNSHMHDDIVDALSDGVAIGLAGSGLTTFDVL